MTSSKKMNTALSTLKYLTLPGILPRLRNWSSNTKYLAYFMALVFQQVRLIPATHPVLNPTSIGSFGCKDILSIAAHNLKPSWKNADQITIFIMFLFGIVLLISQFFLLASLLIIHSAKAASVTAGPVAFTSMFETARPEKDIALMMLDKVFGVPGLFNSSEAPASASAITPFTHALQSLFEFYSWGMLFVAGIIVMYFAFVVIAETVQTGTPFGKRFASVYAPLRLCIAVLLLLPVAHGYNIGQHITLHAAKWGSGLATNSWLLFVNNLSNPLGLSEQDLLAAPKVSDIGGLLKFFALAHTCRAAYDIQSGISVEPYLIRTDGGATLSENSIPMLGLTFDDAYEFTGKKDLHIRFGEKNEKYRLNNKATGNVYPYCGEIVMRAKSIHPLSLPLYREYISLAASMWQSESLAGFGRRWAMNKLYGSNDGCSVSVGSYPWPESHCQENAQATYMDDFYKEYQTTFNQNLRIAIEETRNANATAMQKDPVLQERGWGGAGIWFNKVAEMNGVLVAAAYNMPEVAIYPDVIEQVKKHRQKQEGQSANNACFNVSAAGTEPINFEGLQGNDTAIASTLNSICLYFNSTRAAEDAHSKASGNAILDMLRTIFGMDALFSLRENEEIHPLAQMTAMGRAIIDRALNFMMYGFGTSIVSGFAASYDLMPGDIQQSEKMSAALSSGFHHISGFLYTLAFSALSAGFILAYIIPLLPFMYFFFAVGRWVQSVFEAMVGIPLWALAHLRIDGEGIPGQAAANGYYLILEIMLRPILILFGMITAITIFTAMAATLNMMFKVAELTLAGHDMATSPTSGIAGEMIEHLRGPIDQLFYTILYAILLYMMAMACFKMIDILPNGVLRWLGAGVSSFSDKAPPQAQNLIMYAGLGSMKFTDDLKAAADEAGQGIGHAAGLPFALEREAAKKQMQNE